MSKGFKFGLQKVLEIREEQEEESKRRFQECQRQKEVTKNKLDNLHNNYKKYGGIKPGEDIIYQKIKRNYILGLEQGIEETKRELSDKERQLEYSRKDLTLKTIERKTVETLKDKQYASFVKEQERVEQINNDEFALYGFMRRLERG
ncbi:MAG: flagellar export protein FliJ [Clostridium sp.]